MTERYELLIATDAEELWARIDDAVGRYTELAASVNAATRLPGSDWCTRDVTGHLLNVMRRYTRRVFEQPGGLAATPRGVDRMNAEELSELAAATHEELLADLAIEMKTVREMFGSDGIRLRATVPFHGGCQIDMAAGLANIIGEFLLHGWDVAQMAGRPWPIADRDALLILNGIMQMVPAYVRRDAVGALAVRLEMPGARPWLIDIARGTGTSRPWQPGDRVDAVLRTPAATQLLTMYGRIGVGTATRRGMRVTGGRRPWRALRLPSMFERP